jgi:hypothetical protein
MVRVPWEQRETAISSGFDPASLTERSARRRVGDAGLGRVVVVPIYLRRYFAAGPGSSPVGLLVRMHPGGGMAVEGRLLPAEAGDESRFWTAIHRATGDPEAIAKRGGWTRVVVRFNGAGRAFGSLVLRDTDWALVCAAFAVRGRARSEPQDAPVERVVARFLGRLDGLDATASAGLWGRLAVEVVTVRWPERLADTRSLRWYASWGRGGFPAGSAGMATGCAGHEMLLDLSQQQVTVHGRPFRVRTLPDWEREQAAHDLRLSPRRLMAWPVSSLAEVLAYFDDISPAPLAEGPQDARPRPHTRGGPQDAL